MAENVIYEDTPFAQYLADIGSDEEMVKQPQPTSFELEEINERKISFPQKLLSIGCEAISYLQDSLSTALPLSEENQFEERFKYLLCTSHLLNETLSIHFYDSRQPSQSDIIEARQYFGGLTRRNLEIIFSALMGLAGILFVWVWESDSENFGAKFIQLSVAILPLLASFAFYRRMRRKAVKTMHDLALHLLEVLVYNCQAFDIKVNKALIMIQEIELVSRGYRLSMPLSPITRIEQSTKTRRCVELRDTLHAILREAFMGYRRAIMTIQSEISQQNLAIMYNMYNIAAALDEDEWNLDDVEDATSLENLRICFQKMHAKRRECLCHFLALDVMTTGRDSHRGDYEQHWAIVNDHLNELGSITAHYLDTVSASSINEPLDPLPPREDILSRLTPFAPDKRLRAYLHKLASIEQHIRGIQAKLYLCNEDARKNFEHEGFIDERESERLVHQYNSIGRDFTFMTQEWEEGKTALTNMMLDDSSDTDTPVNRQSLDIDMVNLDQESTENDENSSERTLFDWSQTHEPLDVPEQYFETTAEPEILQKLTREERIAIQKTKRVEEAKIKIARADSELMVLELKDVLGRRRPKNIEETEPKSQNQIQKPEPFSFNKTHAPLAIH
ncbi:hypothetical protein G9A89_014903 [Geosiphon pyriformis]|nr:hypothetical protein G9A89_014903 [Geosiphon pyriformis]